MLHEFSFFQTQFVFAVSPNAKIDVEKYFSKLLNDDKNLSAGIAAIKTLLMVLEKTNCKSSTHKTKFKFHHNDS